MLVLSWMSSYMDAVQSAARLVRAARGSSAGMQNRLARAAVIPSFMGSPGSPRKDANGAPVGAGVELQPATPGRRRGSLARIGTVGCSCIRHIEATGSWDRGKVEPMEHGD